MQTLDSRSSIGSPPIAVINSSVGGVARIERHGVHPSAIHTKGEVLFGIDLLHMSTRVEMDPEHWERKNAHHRLPSICPRCSFRLTADLLLIATAAEPDIATNLLSHWITKDRTYLCPRHAGPDSNDTLCVQTKYAPIAVP